MPNASPYLPNCKKTGAETSATTSAMTVPAQSQLSCFTKEFIGKTFTGNAVKMKSVSMID